MDKKNNGGYKSNYELRRRGTTLLKEYVIEFLDKGNYKQKLQYVDGEVMISCNEVYLIYLIDFIEEGLLSHFK
jgi:hypothetical protein